MDVGPLLVFSPHLDDAVLSLGNLVAAHPGSVVVTVLAGMPPDEQLVTEWDTSCGFATAGETMRARWAEDESAVAALGASAIHLDFLDRQYGDADRRSISVEIERIIAEHPDHQVFGPLGLIHPDHILVSDAFVDALEANAADDRYVYADIPYYAMGGSLERRRAELEARDVVVGQLCEVSFIASSGTKNAARAAYTSQMLPLGKMPLDLPELTAAVRCTSRR